MSFVIVLVKKLFPLTKVTYEGFELTIIIEVDSNISKDLV